MTENTFWTLIEDARTDARRGSTPWTRLDPAAELLVLRLSALDPEEILAFDAILTVKLGMSYRWDLWGAAYIINNGCSDDGFDYFRGWLIAQGRAVFEAAIRNPESLADAAELDCECEAMLYVAYRAYVNVTGQEPPAGRLKRMVYDLGKSWHEMELPERYPNLWTAFSGAQAA